MKKTTLTIVLLWIVLAAVAANIVMTVKFRSEHETKPSLPCAAIPTQFVMEYPDCTDKLLRSMNVTKLKIRSVKQSGRFGSGYGSNTTQ